MKIGSGERRNIHLRLRNMSCDRDPRSESVYITTHVQNVAPMADATPLPPNGSAFSVHAIVTDAAGRTDTQDVPYPATLQHGQEVRIPIAGFQKSVESIRRVFVWVDWDLTPNDNALLWSGSSLVQSDGTLNCTENQP